MPDEKKNPVEHQKTDSEPAKTPVKDKEKLSQDELEAVAGGVGDYDPWDYCTSRVECMEGKGSQF